MNKQKNSSGELMYSKILDKWEIAVENTWKIILCRKIIIRKTWVFDSCDPYS